MKKQRILSFLLALVMTVSLLPGTALAAKTEDFTDVSKSDWFYKYVDFVTDEEYFVGTSETTFSPEMSMTRAMFVVVLAALEGAKVDNNVAPFADVPAGTWYSGAVKWAADNGVVAGVGDNKFAPDTAISREQMAVMMDAYVDWHSAKHGENHKLKAQVKGFGDSAKIASWATEAVENCRVWGLIAGAPDGNYYPQNTATRAEVATVIYNLAWLVYGGGGGGGGTTYTVEYFLAEGADAYATYEDLKYKAKHTVIAAPAEEQEPEGKDFDSWNTKADGTGTEYAPGDVLTVKSDVDLFAVWTDESVEVTKYNINYRNTDGSLIEAVEVEPGEYEITKTLDNEDGKYFIGWLYGETTLDMFDDAADKVVVENADVDLYAVYVVDYIYNALNGIEVTVKDKAQEKLNAAQDAVIEKLDGTKVPDRIVDAIGSIEFADKNGDGQFSYGVENGNSYVIVSGVTVGDPNELNTTEHEQIVVAGQIEADADTVVYIAETAVTKAIELMGFAAENAPTKAEVQEIVDDLVAALKNKVAGIDITKAEAKAIAEAVYAKVEAKALAGLNYTKQLWVENFKGDEGYYTDDITIVCGDIEVVITVDNEKGAYYEGSKKDAIVDLSKAIAKDLYADLKACTEFTALDEITLDAEAVVKFSANEAYEDNTNYFPYDYPVKATLNLTGSAADNIEYQFVAKNAHNVKINVTEGVEAAYVEILNKALDEVTLEAMALATDVVVDKAVESLNNYSDRQTVIDYLNDDEFVTTIYNKPLQKALDEYLAGTKYNDLFVELKADNDTAGLVYYIEAMICDEMLGRTKFATESVIAAGEAAAANLSVDQLLAMAEAAGVASSNYAKYVEKLAALKSIDTLKDVELGSLAVILNSDAVKNAYAKVKDIGIGRLTDLVRFIPDEASVVIGGKTITEETLANIREAETVGDACKAAAALLSNLKGLSLSDFDGDGQTITVKYEGSSYQPEFTLGLVLDFQ